MNRCSLITMLIATQLLSWSGPAVYLCLGHDGSVGFDLGPQHCGRCQHHADDDDQCCQHEAIQTDCDCTHLQLSQQTSPTTIQRGGTSTASSNSRLIVFSAPIVSLMNGIATDGTALLRPHLIGPTSSPLANLATVMLRC